MLAKVLASVNVSVPLDAAPETVMLPYVPPLPVKVLVVAEVSVIAMLGGVVQVTLEPE